MTRELPKSPSVSHLRKEAKKLLHRCRSNDSAALDIVTANLPRFSSGSSSVNAASVCLCDVQTAFAHEHGFQNWECLVAHAEAINSSSPNAIRPFDDPRFAQPEYRAELARSKRLPEVGDAAVSRYGVKYTVVDYQPAVAPYIRTRVSRGGPSQHLDDLVPIINFTEMSSRLHWFCSETNCSTSRDITFLDSIPRVREKLAAQHLHEVSLLEGVNLLQFLFDAEHLHETIIAHELGHIWIEMMDRIEDYRHLKPQWDSPKIEQFQHIQSFVLDLRVNELIGSRGFDMSIIKAHQLEAIRNTAFHCARRARIRTDRAAAGMINTLATVMVEQRNLPARAADDLSLQFEVIELQMPEVYEAARKFAASVERHGYSSMQAVQRVVDECASVSFALTGESFDPDRDLVDRPPAETANDKYPDLLQDLPLASKLEVIRATIRLGILDRACYNWSIDPTGRCDVTIAARNGDPIEPVVLTFQLSPQESIPGVPPGGATTIVGRFGAALNPHGGAPGASLRNSATGHGAGRSPGAPKAPPKPPSLPPSFNPGGQTNSGPGHFRNYSSGLGLWLSQVGFEQQALGEKAYEYAMNNPVNYVDPSGDTPISVRRPRQPRHHRHGVWLCWPKSSDPHMFISTTKCGAWEFLGAWWMVPTGLLHLTGPVYSGPSGGYSSRDRGADCIVGCVPGWINNADPHLLPVDPRSPNGPHIPGAPTPDYNCLLLSTDRAAESEVCKCIEQSRKDQIGYGPGFVCQTWVEDCLGDLWPASGTPFVPCPNCQAVPNH